jgi:hypothetical protein
MSLNWHEKFRILKRNNFCLPYTNKNEIICFTRRHDRSDNTISLHHTLPVLFWIQLVQSVGNIEN